MKRKGFTLIELLAVIVILAVIALITIPLIGNIIEDSRKKALEQSVNGIVEAARYFTLSNDGIYKFVFNDTTQGKTEEGDYVLDYKGQVDAEGFLYIDNDGNISLCFMNDNYYVYKNYNSGIYIGNRTESDCTIKYDALTNKYIAYLDDGTGTAVEHYTKSEIDIMIGNLNTNLSNYALKSDVEALNSTLNNYATKEELEEVKNNSVNTVILDYSNTSIPETKDVGTFLQLVLDKLYPKTINLMSDFTSYFGSWSEYTGSVSIDTNRVSLTFNAPSAAYLKAYYSSEKYIDLTNYKTLSLVGTFYSVNTGGNMNAQYGIYLVNKVTGSTITLTEKDYNNSSTTTYTVDESINIEDISGEYQIKFMLQSWIGYPVTLNINTFTLS